MTDARTDEVEEFDTIPDFLLDVETPVLAPPLTPALDVLPFGELPWEAFESLILRLVQARDDLPRVALYGTRGQKQEGIDVYARRRDSSYATYQCKRYADFAESDIKKAVDVFLDGKWARKSSVFVLCTTASTVRTEFSDAIEVQATRLAGEEEPIGFEVWDAECLAGILKDHPELVVRAFGRPWAAGFLPGFVEDGVPRESAVVAGLHEHMDRLEDGPRFVSLAWARPGLQKSLARYQDDRPRMTKKLLEHVGDDFGTEETEGLIRFPPAWLADADDVDWEFIAEVAEARFTWSAAAMAWERAAGLSSDSYSEAGYLAAAAAAADVAGEPERRRELLELAQEVLATHPRVLVLGMSDMPEAADQMTALQRAEPQNEDDENLVNAQRALACMRLPDVDQAQKYVDMVEAMAPHSLTTRSLKVCLEVQRGRLSLLESEALDARALERVAQEGERLRTEFIEAGRFDDAVRTLMLTVDAYGLLWSRNKAEALLRSATPDELASEDGIAVLGHIALRLMFFDAARALIQNADVNDPDVRLVRASVALEMGSTAEKAEALGELDELLQMGEFTAHEAAFLRLAATFDNDIPWSAAAEEVLRDSGHERQLRIVKAFRASERGQYPDRARAELGDYADLPWARALVFRCSLGQKNHSLVRQAARDVLAVGPSQAVEVEAGEALARCGAPEEAQPVLVRVARSPTAPVQARCDAYSVLMTIAGRQKKDWRLAGTFFDDWVKLRPYDKRASKWAPSVYAHRARA